MGKQILVMMLLVTACTEGENINGQSDVLQFSIAANTVPCEGVAPMRCLVVNGELFYDEIEGYEHAEGEEEKICVARLERSEPLPADAGRFSYRRVNCE